MTNCTKCGAINNSEAKFCVECGYTIKSAPSKTVTIGRGSNNSLRINDNRISNYHCEIASFNGSVTIKDVNSTNGTFVNGNKIISRTLQKGDKVTLGKTYYIDWETIIQSGGSGAPTPSIPKGSYKDEYIVGRNADCDKIIDNVRVSRRHCRLYREGDTWFVEDLNSINGTFLNGVKINRAKIESNDFITIGGVPFTLESFLQSGKSSLAEISISAQHLAFYGGGRKLIDDISLNISSGQFVGLIGPSGAGKSTLMFLLCGINRPKSGDVRINGESMVNNPDLFKGQIGYVPQDDILHRELQVTESLQYTGKLRLGHKIGEAEIEKRADKVTENLRLTDARNVSIGSPEDKGISGGQRKKVNLGQELMTDPNILVLDEPTSGLDPRSDREVMQILRSIAEDNKIVLLTTHNISTANFKFLTHVIVLTPKGKLAYYGPASEACRYFGVDDPVYIFDKLDEKLPDEWKEQYIRSQYYSNFSKPDSIVKKSVNSTEIKGTQSDFMNQFLTLTFRYMRIKSRQKFNLFMLLAQAPIIALLIYLLFTGEGKEMKAIFILVIASIWLGCSNAVQEMVKERSIYKRERMVNLTIPAYFSSKIVVLTFFSLIQSLFLVFITYTEFKYPQVGYLFLIIFFTSIIATILGLLISALSKTEAIALTILPLVLIPMVIFSGLVQHYSAMTDNIKIFSWLWLSRWSYQISLINSDSNGVNALGFETNAEALCIIGMTIMLIIFITGVVVKLKSMDRRK